MAETTTARGLGVDRFAEQFETARPALPGAGIAAVEALRATGMERFVRLGLPTNRVEEWKYTSLRPLTRKRFVPAPANVDAPDAAALPGRLGRARRIVLVNGRWSASLSDSADLPAGVSLRSLASALADAPDRIVERLGRDEPADHALVALNAALMADGIVLEIAPGVRLAEPIELLCLTLPGDAPIMAHTRHLVVLGDGAEATLIERHLALGAGEYMANGATAIEVGEAATLRHYKLQDEGPEADHFHTRWVDTAADAVYDSIVMTVGARLSRNQIRARVNGAGARIRLDGTYMLRDRQHADHTTMIDHLAPSAESRQVYKGAIDERARGVFQGQIIVRQEAQKTDGHQLNRALLLSDEAEIDAKPNLEIYADDVKCSHGATAGDLDEDALFYLRARGIDAETARGLLIAAFLDEVVGDVEDAATRALFEARVERWVAERGSGR